MLILLIMLKGNNKKKIIIMFLLRMQAIGRTTEWHEGHQKFEVTNKNKQREKII